jgi:hypothetical protein
VSEGDTTVEDAIEGDRQNDGALEGLAAAMAVRASPIAVQAARKTRLRRPAARGQAIQGGSSGRLLLGIGLILGLVRGPDLGPSQAGHRECAVPVVQPARWSDGPVTLSPGRAVRPSLRLSRFSEPNQRTGARRSPLSELS